MSIFSVGIFTQIRDISHSLQLGTLSDDSRLNPNYRRNRFRHARVNFIAQIDQTDSGQNQVEEHFGNFKSLDEIILADNMFDSDSGTI